MQILVNTDRNIEADADLVAAIEDELSAALSRVADRVTRVEVHLADENSDKFGTADKRCVMEARPAGQQPVVVTHHAASLDEACGGATEKLKRLLEKDFDQQKALKGSESIRYQHPPEDLDPIPGLST